MAGPYVEPLYWVDGYTGQDDYIDCYVADGYWVDGYTEQDYCIIIADDCYVDTGYWEPGYTWQDVCQIGPPEDAGGIEGRRRRLLQEDDMIIIGVIKEFMRLQNG